MEKKIEDLESWYQTLPDLKHPQDRVFSQWKLVQRFGTIYGSKDFMIFLEFWSYEDVLWFVKTMDLNIVWDYNHFTLVIILFTTFTSIISQYTIPSFSQLVGIRKNEKKIDLTGDVHPHLHMPSSKATPTE